MPESQSMPVVTTTQVPIDWFWPVIVQSATPTQAAKATPRIVSAPSPARARRHSAPSTSSARAARVVRHRPSRSGLLPKSRSSAPALRSRTIASIRSSRRLPRAWRCSAAWTAPAPRVSSTIAGAAASSRIGVSHGETSQSVTATEALMTKTWSVSTSPSSRFESLPPMSSLARWSRAKKGPSSKATSGTSADRTMTCFWKRWTAWSLTTAKSHGLTSQYSSSNALVAIQMPA